MHHPTKFLNICFEPILYVMQFMKINTSSLIGMIKKTIKISKSNFQANMKVIGFDKKTNMHCAWPSIALNYIWWRHEMETFSALLALCAGNSPVTSEFPSQRQVASSFDVFFDLHLNKWLSKQSRGWWFETPSCSLWRHCNEVCHMGIMLAQITSNLTLCLTVWTKNKICNTKVPNYWPLVSEVLMFLGW